MIYFVRAEKDSDDIKAGWIKIGTTIQLAARLKQIAVDIGHTPTVLGVLDGGRTEERVLHGRFDASREIGEWFNQSSPLLAELIERECRPWDGSETEKPRLRSVRLEFDATDHEEVESVARMLKLTNAGFARMAVMDRIRAESNRR